ncbi:DivIVA domain-containing protein [Microbacterium sp.]|uniref:DivIVA domain-containing protein n=1 Tax=Microbacterium sp. TaxID=51671 RepID=UPI000925B1DD|nr:DivIVA domain-containing protein [Microbacterium sp.]OJU72517.1 MAG: cell division protein [Microbacterium sp. 70-38]MBN9170058.1 DivIVA domain-containing protein [Microbacterium sp.]MBN9183549.1 DivIVA domain-containing protein [Microbacterium sp.]MBN9184005.1 DivIVA domain-containing protein [Microbacterium sp.]MBN9187879.1 DivIVA domain-containing protein [Microbacterium sp.]
MALTPDDVVTKQFQHVRFKEGFDPDEVDDFLDEIVVEWRKTIAENDELKAKLAALESGSGAAPAAAEPVQEAAAPEEAPAPAAAVAESATSAEQPAAASAGIIELAQRLHDEHVAEGKAQRDQLIADAQAQAAAIVSEAEAKGRDEMARLDKERTTLETRISELRQFERDYRAQLRTYIEGHLRDLESTATGSGAAPVSAIGL